MAGRKGGGDGAGGGEEGGCVEAGGEAAVGGFGDLGDGLMVCMFFLRRGVGVGYTSSM